MVPLRLFQLVAMNLLRLGKLIFAFAKLGSQCLDFRGIGYSLKLLAELRIRTSERSQLLSICVPVCSCAFGLCQCLLA